MLVPNPYLTVVTQHGLKCYDDTPFGQNVAGYQFLSGIDREPGRLAVDMRIVFARRGQEFQRIVHPDAVPLRPADYQIGVRQQMRGARHFALFDQPPDHRRTYFFGVHVAFGNLYYAQAEAVAVQIIVTALLVVSEAVVEAYDERFGSRMAYETVADEFVRSQPAEGSVEGDDDQIVDPQPFEEADFLVERRQQAQAVGLAERDAGMRLEGEYDAFAALRAAAVTVRSSFRWPLCTPSYDPTVTAGCVKCGSASKP